MKNNFNNNEQLLKELRKERLILKLKKCGIFLKYTMPTIIYIVGAGIGFVKLREAKHTVYEHSTTEYTLGKENPREIKNEYTYSNEASDKIEIHSPWTKTYFKDSYRKDIYTFDVSMINQDALIKGFEENDEEVINDILSNMPEPTITTLEETNPTNINNDIQIIYYKDELTGNIDNAFSLYRKNELNDNIDCTFFLATEPLIIALCILTTYLSKTAVCFNLELIKEGILNKYQFPFSLMSNLKKINMDIDRNKEEEKKMSLSLNK
ncbi:MAG: hypothetical protein IJB83_03260 [Bacilli bacterium]|nr:hypothetical protein [Bacilli bacterium]